MVHRHECNISHSLPLQSGHNLHEVQKRGYNTMSHTDDQIPALIEFRTLLKKQDPRAIFAFQEYQRTNDEQTFETRIEEIVSEARADAARSPLPTTLQTQLPGATDAGWHPSSSSFPASSSRLDPIFSQSNSLQFNAGKYSIDLHVFEKHF